MSINFASKRRLVHFYVLNQIKFLQQSTSSIQLCSYSIFIQLTYQLRFKLVIAYLTSLWESHKFEFIVQFQWTILHV